VILQRPRQVIGRDIERQDIKFIEQALHQLRQLRRSTFGGAEPQFGGGDDADANSISAQLSNFRGGLPAGLRIKSETMLVSSM